MKDLHSHYLYGVDDGSKSLESSMAMLKYAHENGITDIMVTPHYILDSMYNSTKDNNLVKFKELKEYAKNEFDINLYLGNEVYFCEEILDLIKKGIVSTLNNSKYILIEIPMYSKLNNVIRIFGDLIKSGYKPILAHPERYTYYYKKMDFFKELHDMGVMFQINLTSIIGGYGHNVKVMAKKLLKAKLIDFIGSDIHNDNDYKFENMEKALLKIKKYAGENEYYKIIEGNFNSVLNND